MLLRPLSILRDAISARCSPVKKSSTRSSCVTRELNFLSLRRGPQLLPDRHRPGTPRHLRCGALPIESSVDLLPPREQHRADALLLTFTLTKSSSLVRLERS